MRLLAENSADFIQQLATRLQVSTCYFQPDIKTDASLNSFHRLSRPSPWLVLLWRANMAAKQPSSEWEDSPCVKSCPPACPLTRFLCERVGQTRGFVPTLSLTCLINRGKTTTTLQPFIFQPKPVCFPVFTHSLVSPCRLSTPSQILHFSCRVFLRRTENCAFGAAAALPCKTLIPSL